MTKAIQQLSSGLTIGRFGLGLRGDVAGSVNQQTHDGDTINVRAMGNFGVRFLGIDAPEISFNLPDNPQKFISIGDSLWQNFLKNPFDARYPQLKLNDGLKEYLSSLFSDQTAINHAFHAKAAEKALEGEISKDIADLKQTSEEFQFFLAFSNEVIDRYGRLLAYVNRYQTDKSDRPLDYNGRLLSSGYVSPYFIFPNINPFRKQQAIRDSVPDPGTANTLATKESTLRQAREGVKQAREKGVGIFAPGNPLILQPFELRFIAQRRPPNRWVMDLSKNDEVLLSPQDYYTIANVEDRLYIPDEYTGLFLEKGWRKSNI